METIVNYFSTIPSSHRSLFLICGITVFWLIENAFPLFRFQYKKWNHAGINFFFTLTTIFINFILAFLLLEMANWTTLQHFGVLSWLPPVPLLAFTLIGVLLLDLIGAYLVHYIEHKVPFLWRFHLIHHTDIWVDTTSANRHHPGESILRFGFTMLGVLLVGTPIWLVFVYQTLSLISTQFNHANVALPKKLDIALSYFIVSPDMHKVHHHYELPYTDSNYGNIFAIWDRLFGTFRTLARREIIFGIDTHREMKEHNSIKELLHIPFQPKRSSTKKEI